MQEGTFPRDRNTSVLSLLFHARPRSKIRKVTSVGKSRSVVAMSCGSLARTQLGETHPAFRLSASFLHQPFAEAVPMC